MFFQFCLTIFQASWHRHWSEGRVCVESLLSTREPPSRVESHPRVHNKTEFCGFLKRICKQMIRSSLQRRKSRPRLQCLGGLISRDGWHFLSVMSRSPHISSWGGHILIPVLHLRKPRSNAIQWHSLGHTSKDAEQNPRSLPQGFPIHHFLLNYPSQNTRIPHTAPFTIFCRFPRLK